MTNSNRLIAEFMGMKPNKHNTTPPSPTDFAEGYEGCIRYVDMKYHTSWDWLRPVVEEIHTHGCEIVISSNGVTTIYSDKGKVLVEEDSEAENHMLDATYKAVVKYIKEHWAILGGTAQ